MSDKVADLVQHGLGLAQVRLLVEEVTDDKSLVKAVIHAESGYNPNAVSSKGAQGLMQLMPKTAQGLKVSNTFDPKDNIRGGVRYLRFLLDTFKGDVTLALAAYNAGENRVEDWRKDVDFKDMDEFVESIPFTETREYVQAILRNTTVYQRLYGTP